MDRNALEQQVRQIVSDTTGAPADDNSNAAWDSIQNLSIILAVEQATGLQFMPEDMEKMRSVEEIVQMVETKRPT
jgi:acyl carrier protein